MQEELRFKMTDEEIIERAKEVFDVEIKGLEATKASLGVSFVVIARKILEVTENGGIAIVTGVGKNLHVAEKMSAIFASTGTRSIVLNPVQAMHGDLGMVSAHDLLIALSFSGESDEIIRLVPAVRRHNLKIVSMTGNANSTLAKLSDWHLAIPCGKEACPFGMAPTNSVTATLAMGDALAMALIDMRSFSIEEYASNHPAGAIGRALVLKVTDIMRKGARVPRVSPESSVMDALLAMTKAQSGSALIVAPDGRLLGIFTDGDFRRLYASQRIDESTNRRIDESTNRRIDEFMTRSPMFVRDDVYAAELLKIFERKRIDDLPVCDAEGRVVGLVDIQDLPKMKVL